MCDSVSGGLRGRRDPALCNQHLWRSSGKQRNETHSVVMLAS